MDPSSQSPKPFKYKRHEPETTLAFKTFAREWETFLADRLADTSRSPLPDYVVKEVDAYLRCGLLQHGFILLDCSACGTKVPVAHSCKRRGFCPSCGAKRASESTIHLLENVLPHVPYRQYVTTFPHALRFWMATSRQLTNVVHKLVTDTIMLFYKNAAQDNGIKDPEPGGMTFIQRFGSALNANCHYHSIVIEGVYTAPGKGPPQFHHLAGPTDEEVGQIVEHVAATVIAMLRRKKYLSDDGSEVDIPASVDKTFLESEQFTAALAASGKMLIAFGPRAGHKVRRIGKGFGYEEEVALSRDKRCASVNGFTMHANRFIGRQERDKLAELVSYCARGSFSNSRLSLADPSRPEGDLVYSLKSEWSDGTRAILMSPAEFIEKIIALIPPPYVHLSRHFGVLSSHSKLRRQIVLKPHIKKGYVASDDGKTVERLTHAKLLAKTFKIDIACCPLCGGRIFLDSCQLIDSPPVARAMLEAIGINAHPPPMAPPRRATVDDDYDQTSRHPDD